MRTVHQEVKVRSSLTKLKGYSPDHNYWDITPSTSRDTFISTVIAKTTSNKIQINILYEGPTKDVPKDLLDEYLCTGDSSYNPSRPFRWYKPQICVMTTSEEEIDEGRLKSFDYYLKQIENPETVVIYEIEILN